MSKLKTTISNPQPIARSSGFIAVVTDADSVKHCGGVEEGSVKCRIPNLKKNFRNQCAGVVYFEGKYQKI